MGGWLGAVRHVFTRSSASGSSVSDFEFTVFTFSLFFPRNSSNEISFCELPFLYVVLYVVLDSWTHVGLDTLDSSIL